MIRTMNLNTTYGRRHVEKEAVSVALPELEEEVAGESGRGNAGDHYPRLNESLLEEMEEINTIDNHRLITMHARRHVIKEAARVALPELQEVLGESGRGIAGDRYPHLNKSPLIKSLLDHHTCTQACRQRGSGCGTA